jgi:hypothetical protein
MPIHTQSQRLYRYAVTVLIQPRKNQRWIQMLYSFPPLHREARPRAQAASHREHAAGPAPAMCRTITPKEITSPHPTLESMLGSTKGPVRAQRAAAGAGRESKARGDLICGPATSRRCPARSRRRCQGWSPWRTCRCRLSPWWRRHPKRPTRPRAQAAASSTSPPRAHTPP